MPRRVGSVGNLPQTPFSGCWGWGKKNSALAGRHFPQESGLAYDSGVDPSRGMVRDQKWPWNRAATARTSHGVFDPYVFFHPGPGLN